MIYSQELKTCKQEDRYQKAGHVASVKGSHLLTTSLNLFEDDLSSARGIDYRQLRDFLKARNWRKADEETYRVMRQVIGSGLFNNFALQQFPACDLQTIDGLWVKYSQGKFGFSVQKRIYLSCGGQIATPVLANKMPDSYAREESWNNFCNQVGWKKQVQKTGFFGQETCHWDWQKALDFNYLSAPAGHLPGDLRAVVNWRILFSRL